MSVVVERDLNSLGSEPLGQIRRDKANDFQFLQVIEGRSRRTQTWKQEHADNEPERRSFDAIAIHYSFNSDRLNLAVSRIERAARLRIAWQARRVPSAIGRQRILPGKI